MNTDEGDPVYDGSGTLRGYGVGMPGADLNSFDDSIEAMKRRITVRTDMCPRDKCTETDLFLIAALSQNGPGFTKEDMNMLLTGQGDLELSPNDTTYLDFNGWLKDGDHETRNREMIGRMAANVQYLENQGWTVPDGIDWDYVCKLSGTCE